MSPTHASYLVAKNECEHGFFIVDCNECQPESSVKEDRCPHDILCEDCADCFEQFNICHAAISSHTVFKRKQGKRTPMGHMDVLSFKIPEARVLRLGGGFCPSLSFASLQSLPNLSNTQKPEVNIHFSKSKVSSAQSHLRRTA